MVENITANFRLSLGNPLSRSFLKQVTVSIMVVQVTLKVVAPSIPSTAPPLFPIRPTILHPGRSAFRECRAVRTENDVIGGVPTAG